jgi:hypothetical protein
MKMDLFSSAAAGFFAVSASLFAQFGTSWPVVIVALIGAGLALLEEEELRLRPALVVSVFNILIGALGGPLIAHRLKETFEIDHPGLTLILAFLAAYVAHDVFSKLRQPLVSLAARLIGGHAK